MESSSTSSPSPSPNHKSDGIVVAYDDPSGTCYTIIEKTLLKILAMMVTLPNPENLNAPYRLNDRVGVWPAHEVSANGPWHSMPYLALYLVVMDSPSVDSFSGDMRAAILGWVARVQATGAGHVVIFVMLDSPTLSMGAQAAAYLWKKLSPAKSIFMKELASQGVVMHELHPLLREGAEQHSILRREAEPLAALMARQLGLGFARRIERYRQELKSRDVSHDSAYVETLEGLAFVYSKLSMFSAALLLYDDWELLLDKSSAPPPASSSSSSSSASSDVKRRCVHCGLWFVDESLPCRYHSGRLVSLGRYSLVPKWTCCGGFGETCPPCIVGTHVVDHMLSRVGLVSSEPPHLTPVMAPFRPIVHSPTAPLLDPSSHLPITLVDSPPLRQYLLARQCRLLAVSGQFIKLGRRLLRFVYFAIRSSRLPTPEAPLEPLALEAWCYRICLEATRIFLAGARDTTTTIVDDDPVGRAIVLAGLYKVMRFNLSSIGVAWFAPPPIRVASWDELMQLYLLQQDDEKSPPPSSSSSRQELTVSTTPTPERVALKVSAFHTQAEPSLEDPWFVNADIELEVPRGRFPNDHVSPLLLGHRGLRAYLASRAALVDSLRRLAGKELMAWKVSGRERTEMCATVELARVYYDLGRFDEAQILLRSVHHRYATSGWAILYAHCLVLLAESELRMGHLQSCASVCLQLLVVPSSSRGDSLCLYAERLLRLVRLPNNRNNHLVKPLEPFFEITKLARSVTLHSQEWPLPVLVDRVVAQFFKGEGEILSVCLASDITFHPRESISWDVVPAPGSLRFHKLVVEIGILSLVHLVEDETRATRGNLTTRPITTTTNNTLHPPLPTIRAPPLVPMDDALLPSLAAPAAEDDDVTLFYDPVAELGLILEFHCPLIECTIWCTFGRLSMINSRGENMPSPFARCINNNNTQLVCEGREDDALVIKGKFQSGDQVHLGVPIRARLLWERFGEEHHHLLEFILACRVATSVQAHAAFRHVKVRVMAPFSTCSASLISSGSFRHLVVRVVCQAPGLVVKALQVSLPKEWFLVSSESSLLGAAPVGTVLWFRYCLARFGGDEEDGNSRDHVALKALESSLVIACQLEHSRGARDDVYSFTVNLRDNLGPDPMQELVTNLVEAAFSSNTRGVDESAAASSSSSAADDHVLSTKTLLNLRGNVFGPKDAVAISAALQHCGRALQRLILENCDLGTRGALDLATALAECHQLRTLNLFGNSIAAEGIVAVCFACKYSEGGRGLRELDLGRNDCSHQTAAVALASLVAASPTLRVLRLWRCRLQAAGIDALTTASAQENSLRELDLGHNALGPVGALAVANWLRNNPALETLSLWYTGLGPQGGITMALALAVNEHLRSLDMRDNGLTDQAAFALSDALRANSSLTDLQLQDNEFGENGLLELGKVMMHGNYAVESLVVVENPAHALESLPHLERIGEGVKRNRSFKDKVLSADGTFVVSGQGLTALPPQLNSANPERLTVLSLERNDIRSFSPSLARLTALTVLNMCHNQLTQIGSELSALRDLNVLRLEGNLISKAPASLFVSLTKLQTLDLASNRLEEFPECVNVLPALQRLSVSRNAIVSFPLTCAARLTSLQVLDISHNRLASIPPDMAQMTKLRILHLQSNALEMLPPALGRMEWDSFRVEENPLSCIPASTIAKGSRGVLYYLRDLATGSDYFYRVKLLVTGQANVGKTTLLSALKNEVGNVNKVLRLLTGKGRRSSTSGIALEDWKPHKSIITFSTWDFGGQLVYYTTHQFFLSKRALYLLVFSMAKGLHQNRLLSWLNSIQSRAPGVAVLLVGTCLDDKKRCTPAHVVELAASVRRTITAWERSFPQGERLQILKNSDDVWFYPVSSLTGEGIAEVRTRLLDAAADQPSLRERVPLLYLKLLDVVRVQRRATENAPIATWARLREWAGFDDEKQLERAVQLLHDWGELLWFGESPALRDVVVLSPQWLTSMFATIISSKENDDVVVVAAAAAAAVPTSNNNNTSTPSMSESERSADTQSEDAEYLVMSPTSSLHRRRQSNGGGGGPISRPLVGIIEKRELALRWAAYDATHYPFFETLLERFDLWIPLDGGARFLVPCLLAARSDEEECGLEWGQVLYGRAFTLPFPLHGFFERCLVQLHRLFTPVRHWKGEALLAGSGSMRLFAQLRDCHIPNHVSHGQRVAFYFAALPADQLSARAAVSSVMFIVHNFLQDWYNPSLRDQVVTEALCPKCCSAEHAGGTFDMQDVLRTQVAGAVTTVACPLCTAPLGLVSDLVPEMLDPVHARSDYATEVEELRHVADGAFSRVFQCRWRGNEIVAVKKLRVLSITVAWFLEFLQEISMLQNLRHKNLVSIRAAYLRPLCIVLEWVAGGTLDQAISRFQGPHDWPVLWTVLRDIAVGMAFLHSQALPIYHRDLKTMNILVCHLQAGADPAVKIADLGSSCPSLGKVSGRIIHNPRWKPPELFSGVEYTAASDVYCFALIMWELVGRTIPFHELNWPSVIEDRILLGERPSMRGLEDVTDDYRQMMQSCWAQDPNQRPTFDAVVQMISTRF